MSRLTLALPSSGVEWTDESTGCLQRTGFVGPAGGRLFATLHLPSEPPTAAVVVCSPLFVEAERNYRREVLLGRALAGHGVAAVRFHYRGTGNSDWLEAVSLESMAEDAATAAQEVVQLGAQSVGAVGSRIGAAVAAGLLSAWPGAPLVMWEPVVRPSSWLREVARASRIAALTDHGGEPPSTATSVDVSMEAVGYAVHPGGFAGLEALDPPPSSPVLLVQLDRQTALKRPFEEAAARWTARGSDVSTATFTVDQPWWFLDHEWTTTEEGRQRDDLCERTARWLAERLGR